MRKVSRARHGAGEGERQKNSVRRAESGTWAYVVAIDYGSKRNIFRSLVEAGARVTVVPAAATLTTSMALMTAFSSPTGRAIRRRRGAYTVP